MAFNQFYPYQTQQPMSQPMPYMDRTYQGGYQTPQIPAQQNTMLQQNTQQQNASFLSGKIVENKNFVDMVDIPMTGEMFFFPQADEQYIYTKRWLNNGKTDIGVFKRVFDEQGNNSTLDTEKLKFDLSDEVTEVFMNRFDDVISRIEKIEKAITPAKTSRTKKESDEV